ncbi:DUF2029 domain-containing protein, partial [bacterium]|nr:DUF2029 domain-containing protein [bacterium]
MISYFSAYNITFLLILALGLGLSKTQGQYDLGWITITFSLFVFWVAAKWNNFNDWLKGPDKNVRILSGIALIFAIRLASNPKVIYHLNNQSWSVLRTTLFIVPGLILFAIYKPRSKWVFPLLLVVSVVVRVLTLFASPNPHIDVFANTSLAVIHLLNGLNPYAQIYPDIYEGLRTYKIASGILYPPFTLYSLVPFQFLFHDVRIAFILSDIGIAIFFKLLAARLKNPSLGKWLALTWLYCPVSLFILEQSWIDTLLLFQFCIALMAIINHHLIAAGVVLGAMLATKQYAVIFVLLSMWAVYNNRALRDVFKISIGAVIMVVGSVFPFVFLDFWSFKHSVAEMPLQEPFRFDSFSMLAVFKNSLELELPPMMVITISIFALTLALVFLRNKGFKFIGSGLIIAFGFIFYFGKQAFCNYYQIILFLLLLTVLLESSDAFQSNKHLRP